MGSSAESGHAAGGTHLKGGGRRGGRGCVAKALGTEKMEVVSDTVLVDVLGMSRHVLAWHLEWIEVLCKSTV